jgi:hypothetical protein
MSTRTKVLLFAGCLFVGGLAAGIIVERVTNSSGGNATVTTTAKLNSVQPGGSTSGSASHTTTPSADGGTGENEPVGTGSSASSDPESVVAPDAYSSYDTLRRELPGPVAVAVMPVGSLKATLFGSSAPAHGWSTTKIPVIAALMTALGAQPLSNEQQTEVRHAITESSNEAILELFHSLERIKGDGGASEAVEHELREAGDPYTVVATQPPPPGAVTTFGQTEWAPESAALFFGALDAGCLLSVSNTRRILSLMQQIIPADSWGLGSAGFSHVAFKGGWGPEGGGYLVRQSGIVDPGRADATAVAIIAHPPPGSSSFDVGTEMLTRTATWLRSVLRPSSHAIACH